MQKSKKAAAPAPSNPITLKAVIAANSGHRLEDEKWTVSGERYEVLVQQSEDIAAKLKLAGIDPYRKDTMPICMVGLLSGEVKRVVPYINSNLIPVVQSANHREALKALRFYCEPRPYIRMFVITTGDRCGVGLIGKHHKALARKISKWAASPICKDRGVEVIFARHEITFDVLFCAHLHAHVLVDCHQKLGGEEWSNFLAETQEFFEAKIMDSGKLRNPQEAVKYCLKPAEIEKLSGNMVAKLYKQLWRQKLCRFLGGLLAFRRQLDKDKLKIASVRRKIGGAVYWDTRLVAKEGNAGAKYARKSTKPPTDIVLGLTVPCAIFRPMLEPCLVVGAFSGNVDELLKKRGLQHWKDAALESVNGGISGAAKAASSSTVHTSTATVQAKKASSSTPKTPAEAPSLTPSSPALVKTGRVYKLNSPQQETEEQLKERNERAEKRKAVRESNLVQDELPLKTRKPRHPRK